MTVALNLVTAPDATQPGTEARPRARLMQPGEPRRVVQTEQLLHRLIVARERQILPLRHVQAVAQRPGAMPPIQRELARASRPRPAGVGREDHQPGNATPTPSVEPRAASIDLNQITEQVIRTIDQRIIAARDRMGRI